MTEKIIKEGGYQPTEDPPSRPPANVLKPAADRPANDRPAGSQDRDSAKRS